MEQYLTCIIDDRGRDEPREEREMKTHAGDGGAEGMGVDGLIESNWDQVCESFDDMGLHQQLLRGIYGYGFEKPSGTYHYLFSHSEFIIIENISKSKLNLYKEN